MTADPRPPRLARRLLQRALPDGPIREGLMGDLEELHAARATKGRRRTAALWYWRQALGAAVRYGFARTEGAKRKPVRRDAPRGSVFALLLADAGAELRGALRRLRRNPGFTAAAVLILALGIGACAALLTVIHGVLWKPLPYPHAERLVVIEHELPGFDMPGERTAVFGGQYAQLAHYLELSRAFEELGGLSSFDAAITGEAGPQYLRMATATAGFFRALGLPPETGRLLDDDDPAPDLSLHGPALLSHPLWSQRFGRNPGVLGTTVKAEGYDFEVVGVLSERMTFPPERVELWGSLPVSRLRKDPEWSLTLMVGRLAPGVTAEQAQEELNRLIPEMPDRFAAAQVRRAVEEGRLRAKVTPLRTWIVGGVERALWLLLGAVGLLLAVACVNVTNLLLVRAEARRREIAVRSALGASGRHIARTFVAESLALVSMAAAAGVALALLGVEVLVRYAPANLPRLEAIDAGWRVAAFGALPAILCIVVFALVPWFTIGHRSRVDTLVAHRGTAGRAQLRVRHTLVALQLAMSLMLLVGSGLILRSLLALSRVELGFEERGVLTFRIPFPFQEAKLAGPAGGAAIPFYERLSARIAALPGVSGVGYGGCVPLSEVCGAGGLSLRREDRPPVEGALPVVEALSISPGYLETLRVPLLQGRSLEHRDHEQRTSAAVISEKAARLLFPGEDPLGRRLVQDGRPEWTPFTVVGVVGNVQHSDPRKAQTPFVYLPLAGDFRSFEPWSVSYVVRTSGAPTALVEPIRQALSSLRPDIPMAHVDTMSNLVVRSTARLRFAVWLLAFAAAVTLALSVIGTYGVMAYMVILRRSEFGIRMALGADGPRLRAMVLRHGALTAAAGLLIGLAGALATGRLLRSLLFEVEPTDPSTYAAVSCGLALIALAAVDIPARRASRLDPAEILRTE